MPQPPKPPAKVLADNELLKLPVQGIEFPSGQGPFQIPKAIKIHSDTAACVAGVDEIMTMNADLQVTSSLNFKRVPL